MYSKKSLISSIFFLVRCFLFLFTITFQGQVLHHQMISSQGNSTKMSNGLIVKQTVGQQSLTGTSKNNNYVVMQGFQQSVWAKYIASSKIEAIDGIKTIIYPNPFTANVNFQFSKPITGIINVTIYDVLGRLILEENKNAIESILTLDLSFLPTSVYLIRLQTSNLNYFTKIIKQ